MGVIRRGILGGFRNKVANIVGTSWKGIAVIKSLPLSVANPRSAGQVFQRGRFTFLTKLGSIILSQWIKPLWDRGATRMSGFNAFISTNINAFDATGKVLPNELRMARGRMIAPVINNMAVSAGNLTFLCNNPSGDRFALPTDRVFFLAVSSESFNVIGGGDTSKERGAGNAVSISVPYNQDALGNESIHLWVAYLRADNTEVSEAGKGFLNL